MIQKTITYQRQSFYTQNYNTMILLKNNNRTFSKCSIHNNTRVIVRK